MKKLLALMVCLLMIGSMLPVSLAESLEPIEFTVYYIEAFGGMNPGEMKVMKDYAERHADKNVTIHWESLGDASMAQERISVLFGTGDYADAIWGNPLQESQVSTFSTSGLIIPLDNLITAENTPNIYKFFERVPSAKAISTLPDEHFYTLPRFNGNPGDYLESPIWVNKAWMEKLGIEAPKTIEEFETMLQRFKDEDPNGNGEADEIPLLLFNGDSLRHPEAWLGMYGIPTKDNTFDSFVYVDNKEVKFAPMQDAYKEYIKWMADLFKKGLIYEDTFTTTVDTVTAKLNGEIPVVGVLTTKNVTKFRDQYTQILPPTVEGYQQRWFYHPGALGIKNFFTVTSNCKSPERLLNYFDDMWTTEQTLRNNYGDMLVEREDGTFGFQDPPEGLSEGEYRLYNTLGVMYVLYAEDFGTKFDIGTEDQDKLDSYHLYYDILNKEIWPRPYFTDDLSYRATELRTDIFNTVSQMKARWITGQGDVEAEWDGFISNLKTMGIEEYISLYQQAYDVYINAFTAE